MVLNLICRLFCIVLSLSVFGAVLMALAKKTTSFDVANYGYHRSRLLTQTDTDCCHGNNVRYESTCNSRNNDENSCESATYGNYRETCFWDCNYVAACNPRGDECTDGSQCCSDSCTQKREQMLCD